MNEFLTSVFCVEVLPILAGVLLVITYYPQLVKTYKTKNVEGFAIMFWVILVMALFCFVINALSLLALGNGSIGYLIAELLNLSMALAMLVMIIVYKINK